MEDLEEDEVDDLTHIKGISKAIEVELNKLGIYRYDQIAAWSAEDVARISRGLGLADAVEPAHWVVQARSLMHTFDSSEFMAAIGGGPLTHNKNKYIEQIERQLAERRLTEVSRLPRWDGDSVSDAVQSSTAVKSDARGAQRDNPTSPAPVPDREAFIVRRKVSASPAALASRAIPATAKPDAFSIDPSSPNVRFSNPPSVDAVEIFGGKLVENVPRQMIVNERSVVEVRLGTAKARDIASGFVGSAELQEHIIDIVETMSVQLIAHDGEFQIESTSPGEQLVMRDRLKGTPYEHLGMTAFGQWIFYVTPRERGRHKLALRISADIAGQGHATLPDKIIPIDVKVSYAKEGAAFGWRAIKLAFTGSMTGLFGALVGGFTSKYWWPPLEAWMQARGWL